MQQVRKILRNLRDRGERLSSFEAVIVLGNGDVVGYKTRVSAMTLGKKFGQYLLILPVAEWRREAEDAPHELVGEAMVGNAA